MTVLPLVRVSLAANIVVLLPVAWGLGRRAAWAEVAYGPASPARAILLAVYLAILIGSVVLCVRPTIPAIATLLALQVMYKFLTLPLIGSWHHPVVASNLAIAALHAYTLVSLWTTTRPTA